MIHETPEAYDLELDLMGAALRDVSVKPHPHSVEIRCGHAIDHAEEKRAGGPATFGSFTTRLHMRDAIDVQHADITLRHGLLRIHAPKARH
jgi:HSP20 family molecular chaperone IbpA